MGRIVSVTNQKGGVGKTTTAINLGAYLADAGKRVLLVDLDAQANASSGLGIPKNSPAKNAYPVLMGTLPAEAAILPLPYPNFFLLPAHRDLTGAEIELVDLKGREYRLKKALAPLVTKFDVIFLDCPPSLGLVTINALSAADGVIIALQSEYFALEGLGELIQTIDRVREAFNPFLEIDGVLLTMVDDRTNLSQQVSAEIRAHFGGDVFSTAIPRSIRLGEAPSFGKPILHYDARSRGAVAYRGVAEEYQNRRHL
jgi:chromosome partitioning protein